MWKKVFGTKANYPHHNAVATFLDLPTFFRQLKHWNNLQIVDMTSLNPGRRRKHNAVTGATIKNAITQHKVKSKPTHFSSNSVYTSIEVESYLRGHRQQPAVASAISLPSAPCQQAVADNN